MEYLRKTKLKVIQYDVNHLCNTLMMGGNKSLGKTFFTIQLGGAGWMRGLNVALLDLDIEEDGTLSKTWLGATPLITAAYVDNPDYPHNSPYKFLLKAVASPNHMWEDSYYERFVDKKYFNEEVVSFPDLIEAGSITNSLLRKSLHTTYVLPQVSRLMQNAWQLRRFTLQKGEDKTRNWLQYMLNKDYEFFAKDNWDTPYQFFERNKQIINKHIEGLESLLDGSIFRSEYANPKKELGRINVIFSDAGKAQSLRDKIDGNLEYYRQKINSFIYLQDGLYSDEFKIDQIICDNELGAHRSNWGGLTFSHADMVLAPLKADIAAVSRFGKFVNQYLKRLVGKEKIGTFFGQMPPTISTSEEQSMKRGSMRLFEGGRKGQEIISEEDSYLFFSNETVSQFIELASSVALKPIPIFMAEQLYILDQVLSTTKSEFPTPREVEERSKDLFVTKRVMKDPIRWMPAFDYPTFRDSITMTAELLALHDKTQERIVKNRRRR